ncbi:PREDICTED: cytochrome b5 isoform X1 [Dinoponera quadriceps]|uniref:Cytochrome b5 n=1 Tax=Dinoponera quadriceps TaxID=609295 RepID=A0A6P3YAX7_DINQU|nr:PREDICTED: cytochrome b5 isoform X1 [Dinoponera quadriceps]
MAEKDIKDKTTNAAPPKFFTRAEVAEHVGSTNTWIIIHNKVYNVTSFLNERAALYACCSLLAVFRNQLLLIVLRASSKHPGGEEVLLEQNGQDATEAFEDIGHSTDARQLMETFKIGELVEEEKVKDAKKKSIYWSNDNPDEENFSGSWRSWLIPIALGVLATLVYRYFISTH